MKLIFATAALIPCLAALPLSSAAQTVTVQQQLVVSCPSSLTVGPVNTPRGWNNGSDQQINFASHSISSGELSCLYVFVGQGVNDTISFLISSQPPSGTTAATCTVDTAANARDFICTQAPPGTPPSTPATVPAAASTRVVIPHR